LWQDSSDNAKKTYGCNAVIGTAAIALLAMGKATNQLDAFKQAETL